MPKIVLIGAGSGFGSRLTADILTFPSLQDSTIVLVDTSPEQLAIAAAMGRRLVEKAGSRATIIATTDRREALPSADYVVMSIRVGGEEPAIINRQIPAKYGVEQTVADTLGPGGIFYFLLNGPAILDILWDMEALCPDAQLIQHTNPMAMNCILANDASTIANVGLCHSVQGTARRLAEYIGAPADEVNYWVAGINHMAWFLRFNWKKEDAYPLLWKAMDDPAIYEKDKVRWEIMRYFGYFVTESSTHMSEYVPYFRRTPALIEATGRTAAQHIESFIQARRDRESRQQGILSGEVELPLKRSAEYSVNIMNAMETNVPYCFNGNVRNTGLITNLPPDCAVEVPCLVDATGVHPCYVGDLPPELAGLNRSNITVQELAVRALLTHDRELVYRAVQLDPLTQACVSLPEMRKMVDELFAAHERLLTI
ncbi:MAG: alpha-galactosidase [Chloroflexi bacterium]|mgnify:CR=1 FL=1|nr:alpha-galactosidase [Chloroflexota bacterium]